MIGRIGVIVALIAGVFLLSGCDAQVTSETSTQIVTKDGYRYTVTCIQYHRHSDPDSFFYVADPEPRCRVIAKEPIA